MADMTPTDTAGLDLLTAKAMLEMDTGFKWEAATDSFTTHYLAKARAVRLAHAKAGVQSVPDRGSRVNIAACMASPYRTEVE